MDCSLPGSSIHGIFQARVLEWGAIAFSTSITAAAAAPSAAAKSLQLCPTLCNPMDCSPGEGNGTPFQYSCLENPMNGGDWKAAVHGVAEGGTWLSDFPFTFHFHALEKETATHSSVLAWRIPGTGEPGGLPSVGSHRVGHD